MNAAADVATAPYEAPAGLAGVSVARTEVSDVLGRQGFYHYRGYNAVDIARRGRVEDAWHLLLRGDLPTAEQRASYMAELGLSDPLWVQYLRWVGQIASGSFGKSFFRSENVADKRGTFALKEEEGDEDYDTERDDDRGEPGRIHLETFDCAQDRYGWRDDAVAIEQCGPNQTDNKKGGAPAAGRRPARIEQCQERHDAALAMIIGAHNQDRVFERDDHDQ